MNTKQLVIAVTFQTLVAWSHSAASAHPGHEHHDHPTPANLRTWTAADGVFELEASYVATNDGKAQLRKKNGELIAVPIDRLSNIDQKWIADRQAEIRTLNETALLALAPTNSEAERPEMAGAFEKFVELGAIATRWDDRYLYVESNGMPDHPMMVGIRAWQQQVPLPQKYTGANAWQIPLHPVPAAQPSSAKNRFLRGAIALAVNGIPIFNPLNNRGDDAYLFGELDEYGGHCGRADDYHYHLAPVHLEKQVGKGSVIAYALDGYPIYGYDEADGAKVVRLDALNGHKDADGHYHYHATKTYPYLNGGFYGEVVERDGQVDPQPRAEPLRPALSPLRGAKIVSFASPSPQSHSLTYDVSGRKGTVGYTIGDDGSVAFSFTDPSGKKTSETYQPRRRPPGDGENRPPREGKRPPPRESDAESEVIPTHEGAAPLVVTSSAFAAGGNLPLDFTCDGRGVSPPVAWSGAPKGTKCFALSLWHNAPDQTKSYWVVYNIPANTKGLTANSKSIGRVGINDKRRMEYDPMCSKGPGVKKYHITVYALSAEVKISPDRVDRSGLLAAIKDLVLAEGTLTYQYERQK